MDVPGATVTVLRWGAKKAVSSSGRQTADVNSDHPRVVVLPCARAHTTGPGKQNVDEKAVNPHDRVVGNLTKEESCLGNLMRSVVASAKNTAWYSEKVPCLKQ